MTYFVTGGTGFIGRFLIDRLLEREGTVHVLVRKSSVKKLDELRPRWGDKADRVVAVIQQATGIWSAHCGIRFEYLGTTTRAGNVPRDTRQV